MAPEKRKLRKRTVVSYAVPEIDDDDYDDELPNIKGGNDALDGGATPQDDSRDSDDDSDGFEDNSDGFEDDPDGFEDGSDDSSNDDDSNGSDDGIDGSQEDSNSQGHGQNNSGGESSPDEEAKPKSIGDDGEEGNQALINRKIKIAISSLTRRANKTFNMGVFKTMADEADQLIKERSSIDGYWKNFGLKVSQYGPRISMCILILAGLLQLKRHPRRPRRAPLPTRCD